MGRIVILDKNMINMIAAGEVIERPASVVKELMENSIDCGATKIIVAVEDGGRKLISVTDNGCGMDAADLACAFEPHATSKVKTSADLHNISTLGFRGEALASIASIAQVKAVSRVKDSQGANCIEIDCDSKKAVSPASGDYGTTIQVRDIFYKLPARRKFLKTANTEMEHIVEQFRRIALANDKLDMTLIHNGREIYRLLAGQGPMQRIAILFSQQVADDLIAAQSDEKNLRIRVFFSKPSQSKTNNKLQYIFLNGRFIRDKFISHAIKEAYRGRIESDRYPIVFLFIDMPFEEYDVNVHPTKVEVRFYNSNLLHSQILGTLREKILGMDFAVDAKLPSANPRKEEIANAMAEFFQKYKPVTTQQQFGFGEKGSSAAYSSRYQGQYISRPFESPTEKHSGKFIQIHDSYIVTETDDGFIIIDQHALHERIMYERLRSRVSSGKLETQKLLIPESFELTDAQADLLNENGEMFEKLGIELVPFGPGAMAVQSFPTLLAKAGVVDVVQSIIDMLQSSDLKNDAQRLLDEVLNMAACKAAIKAGQPLTDKEILQLLEDRQTVQEPGRCPHGRPTTINFSKDQIEKQFKRT